MSTKRLVALSLVLASGATLAQEALTSVEVRAESELSLTIACDSPSKPSLKEVERVLSITEVGEANGLRNKLMEAAAEACAAKTPSILVSRNAAGGVTWKPAKS